MLIDHNPREHWKIIQICTFCHRNHKHHNNSEISIQTTRNAWLLSISFASQASSCQGLWEKKTSQAWASTHPITSGCAETGWLIHKGIRHGQVVLFQPLFLKLTHKHFFRVLSAPLGPFKKKRKGNQPLIFWKFLFPSSSRFLAIWGLCHFASISTLNFGPWLTKLGGAVGAIQKWHTMTMDLVPAGITEKRPFLHSTKKHFFGTKSVFFSKKSP